MFVLLDENTLFQHFTPATRVTDSLIDYQLITALPHPFDVTRATVVEMAKSHMHMLHPISKLTFGKILFKKPPKLFVVRK